MALNGIDISSYQTGIDIAAVNPDFVIVKTTQGTGYVNPAWKDQIRQAYDQNRPIGVYHYVDGSGAAAEADHFVSTVADWNGYVMWCVDWEQGDNSAWGSTAYLTEFIEAVKARNGGKWIMLYASAAVYPHDVAAACNTGKWIAQYADMNPHGWDDAPWTDGTWTARIHQYTGTGRVAGYGGDLDLDIFYGTADEFREYYTAAYPPTTAPDGAALLDVSGVWEAKTGARFRQVMGLGTDVEWTEACKALQYFLTWAVDAYHLQEATGSQHLAVDGVDGQATWKAFQTWWNHCDIPAGHAIPLSGACDAETIRAVQIALNHSWAGARALATHP